MEFGALICGPKSPKCIMCPIKKNCKFFKSPNKIKKTKKITAKENINIFCYLNKNGKK